MNERYRMDLSISYELDKYHIRIFFHRIFLEIFPIFIQKCFILYLISSPRAASS